MEKREIKCDKCGYIWRTKSNKLYITCPNCQRKFNTKDKEVEEDGE